MTIRAHGRLESPRRSIRERSPPAAAHRVRERIADGDPAHAPVLTEAGRPAGEMVDGDGPPAEEVRRQLARILAAPELRASARRRGLLTFLVEETLAGRADTLKGFTVALAVFDRDDTFDAAADPVVRVEARRLRRDLDSYYVAAGAADPVRISIPKGGYVPHFDWRDGAAPQAACTPHRTVAGPDPPDAPGPCLPAPAGQGGRPPAWRAPPRALAGAVALLLCCLVVLAFAAAAWILRDPPTAAETDVRPVEPAVVVLPFRPLGNRADSVDLATGISQELVAGILRFPGFRLYGGALFTGEGATADAGALGRALGIAYVVSGSVHTDDAAIRVLAQISDASTGEVVWSQGYDRPMEPYAIIRAQRDLAGEIAAVLGHPHGTVHKDMTRRVDAGTVPTMASYACILRAYGYRRYVTAAGLDPIISCLRDAVERDPEYSDAWAMLGWLQLDEGRVKDNEDAARRAIFARAHSAARRAVELEPDNTLALKALSAILHYMGDFEEAERLARRAVAQNPNDPDTLAQFGWRLAARGNFEEGISVLERAIARTVDPPPWYFYLPAIHRYLEGDHEGMLPLARRAAVGDFAVGSALLAIAEGAVGDAEGARAALAMLPQSGPVRRDPAAFFRMHGGTDEITQALAAGLRHAERLAARE